MSVALQAAEHLLPDRLQLFVGRGGVVRAVSAQNSVASSLAPCAVNERAPSVGTTDQPPVLEHDELAAAFSERDREFPGEGGRLPPAPSRPEAP